MITPNQIKERTLATSSHGYDIDETNAFIDEIAQSYEAVFEENKELYRKMDILASKIEEYREEEDSIKETLLTAQKAASTVKSEAKEKAEKIISEAREFASGLTKEKTEEAEAIVSDAQAKADETLSNAQSSAAALLQEVKEKTQELIDKSNKEKEYNENLVSNLKEESTAFKASLVALYNAQLEKLQQMMEGTEDATIAETAQSLDDAQAQLDDMLGNLAASSEEEIAEFIEAVDEENAAEAEADFEPIEEAEEIAYDDEPEEDITVAGDADFELTEEALENGDFEEVTEDAQAAEEEVSKEQISFSEAAEQEVPAAEEIRFTKADVDSAVNAFSQETITPIEGEAPIAEIDEEPEFEEQEEEKLPFENFFNVKAETERTDEVISLIPPEEDEDEDDNDLKFRGFFKKKKK